MKRIQKRRKGKQKRKIFQDFEAFVKPVQGLGTTSGFVWEQPPDSRSVGSVRGLGTASGFAGN